jgi:hypothetical protein
MAIIMASGLLIIRKVTAQKLEIHYNAGCKDKMIMKVLTISPVAAWY